MSVRLKKRKQTYLPAGVFREEFKSREATDSDIGYFVSCGIHLGDYNRLVILVLLTWDDSVLHKRFLLRISRITYRYKSDS